MLPLPRHLLKTDPQDALHEIEDDPLSQFLWSLPAMLTRRMHDARAIPAAWMLKSGTDAQAGTECCAQ
jgi:hypothetical protein